MEERGFILSQPEAGAGVSANHCLHRYGIRHPVSWWPGAIFYLLSVLRRAVLSKSIFKAVGYGLLALATLDIAARIDDALNEGADFWKPYSIANVFQPSQFGLEGKPEMRYGKWSMNQLGYRGPDPVPGRTNVVIFGASETFGLYESAGREYARVLENLLNPDAGREHYNVVNLGIPGTRLGRSGYLVRGIEQVHAKIAVIYPSPANYIGTTVPLCDKPSLPVSSDGGMSGYLRIVGKFEQLAKKYVPIKLLTAVRQFSIWRDTRHVAVIDRVPEATIDAFKADLACQANAAQSAGAKVILVTHANYFGRDLLLADMPMMISWRRFYPELKESGFLDLERRANTAIQEVGLKLGIDIVDAASQIPVGPQYFADFVHFTDAGSAKMAALLKPAVLKLGVSP